MAQNIRPRRGAPVLAVLAALVLAALLPSAPPGAAAPPAVEPDFSGYQRLLDDYLSVISGPGEPLRTAFDYESLYVSTDGVQRLASVRDQMLGSPPSRMSPAARKAWGINAYNFLVIHYAADNLYERRLARGKVDGRRTYVRRGRSSVTQMSIGGQGFFRAPLIEIEGTKHSLDSFERHFLFEGFDRASTKAPPKGLDPRVHFALVCAAQGCPPLQPRAFLPESLDAQLDAATRGALASPDHLRWNGLSYRLEGSMIFSWYEADFGGPEGAAKFAKRFAPDSLKRRMEGHDVTRIGAFIPWDWKLNQTPAGHRAPVILSR